MDESANNPASSLPDAALGRDAGHGEDRDADYGQGTDAGTPGTQHTGSYSVHVLWTHGSSGTTVRDVVDPNLEQATAPSAGGGRQIPAAGAAVFWL